MRQIEVKIILQQDDDGFWVRFGPFVMLNFSNLVSRLGGVIGNQLQKWAEDQIGQVPPDYREQPEGACRSADGPG